jgi:hypothetical protein
MIQIMIQLAHRTHLRKEHVAPDDGLKLDKARSVTYYQDTIHIVTHFDSPQRAAVRSRASLNGG